MKKAAALIIVKNVVKLSGGLLIIIYLMMIASRADLLIIKFQFPSSRAAAPMITTECFSENFFHNSNRLNREHRSFDCKQAIKPSLHHSSASGQFIKLYTNLIKNYLMLTITHACNWSRRGFSKLKNEKVSNTLETTDDATYLFRGYATRRHELSSWNSSLISR